MDANSRKQEVGEIVESSYDLEVITWKIPNLSQTYFVVDYGIQSPVFSFAGAIWILKVYFYGQTEFQSKGYVDVIIERLHSEIEEHDFSCKLYCKNVFDKEYKPSNKKFSFHTNHTKLNFLKIMENFKRSLDKWQIAPNDTFTLVCEIQNRKSSENEKFIQQIAGPSRNTFEVGELHVNLYEIKTIKWTICNISSLPSPADYLVQSPIFLFGNAYWALNIYPYFQLKHENKEYAYVSLTRIHSQISEHDISINIAFDDHTNKVNHQVSRSYSFNPNHLQSDAIFFTPPEEQIKEPYDPFLVYFSIRSLAKRNAETELDSQARPITDKNSSSRFSLDIYKNKVVQDLKDLFKKQEDCDVIIKVKEREFLAHQVILKARSPVFYSTFQHDMKEKQSGIINIEDCDPTTFSDFLCFLYCGDVENLSTERVFNLFITADKYEVLDLRSRCLEFIKDNITIDTFCDTIALALQYSEHELIKSSIDFFAKNLYKIIVTVKWQSFITKNPIQGNELLIKVMSPNNS